MEKRLTTQQLTQVVGEVERLANRNQEELDKSEVQKILLELNLPPELLDDAMIQISRKEALIQQHQRTIKMAIAGAVVGSLLIISLLLFLQHKSQTISKVSASSDRITVMPDQGQNLKIVNKGNELSYQVTLSDAPVGEKLALNCNWLDPTGKTAHSNRFETKNITTSVWNTQCRYRLPLDAMNGAWQVQIKTGDRLIKQAPFDVK
jgi:uncharacterized ubiquitin-like protein YukD